MAGTQVQACKQASMHTMDRIVTLRAPCSVSTGTDNDTGVSTWTWRDLAVDHPLRAVLKLPVLVPAVRSLRSLRMLVADPGRWWRWPKAAVCCCCICLVSPLQVPRELLLLLLLLLLLMPMPMPMRPPCPPPPPPYSLPPSTLLAPSSS
jgi:hypothetical protein